MRALTAPPGSSSSSSGRVHGGQELGRSRRLPRRSSPRRRRASARRAGSDQSGRTLKKGSRAADPPRARARPAERSSSSATSSSGPTVAARCQARRSGSRLRSGTAASAVDRRRSAAGGAIAAERTSGWRNVTRPPIDPADPRTLRCGCGWREAESLGRAPKQEGLRRGPRLRSGGEVASSSGAPRVGGRSSPRSGPGRSSRIQQPEPARQLVAVNPCGSSSRASGFPRVSATIRSRNVGRPA